MNMEKMEYAGPFIRYLRKVKQIENSTLCIAGQITQTQLYHIENGKCDIHPNTLQKLFAYLDVDFLMMFKDLKRNQELIADMIHALLFDQDEEIVNLMKKIDQKDFYHSILFPEYLLMKLMYLQRDHRITAIEETAASLSIFEKVLPASLQFLFVMCQGIASREKENLKESFFYFQKAYELRSEDTEGFWNYHIGLLYSQNNEYLQAIDHLTSAYEGFKEQWNIHYMLYTKQQIGSCYMHMGEYKKAQGILLAASQKALQHKNRMAYGKCMEYITYNLIMQKDYENVIFYANMAMKHGTYEIQLCFFLVFSYIMLYNQDQAKALIKANAKIKAIAIFDKLLIYAQDKKNALDCITLLKEMLHDAKAGQWKEMEYFILRELCDTYHNFGYYEEETICLRKLLMVHYSDERSQLCEENEMEYKKRKILI